MRLTARDIALTSLRTWPAMLRVLAVIVLLCCGADSARAGCNLRDGDQLWLVSTRCLPSCGCFDGSTEPRYQIHRYDQGQWHTSTLDDYYASQFSEALTVAHIHGNRYAQSDALERGCQTYHLLRQCDPAPQPIRMVVWSWPSDKISGPLNDIRVKAARTDVEGYYLGYFLSRHNPDSRISLIGHSFGARIICGGLHVLAGGRLNCGHLATPPELLPPVRAVIMAAAMHNYWLAQGQYHSRALSAVESMRIVYNPTDRFLIRYGLAVKGSKPQALGVTGPTGFLGEGRERIELYNACPYIGDAHFQRIYYESATIRKLVRDHALWRVAVGSGSEEAPE